MPFVHQVWTVSFVNICCFSQFKGRRCFSLVIAEQLIDGKGTHRDEGDINAGKNASVGKESLIFYQKMPGFYSLGAHVEEIAVVLHHHLELPHNLHKYIIVACTNTAYFSEQIHYCCLHK